MEDVLTLHVVTADRQTGEGEGELTPLPDTGT
jgi:hypothetical protein